MIPIVSSQNRVIQFPGSNENPQRKAAVRMFGFVGSRISYACGRRPRIKIYIYSTPVRIYMHSCHPKNPIIMNAWLIKLLLK